MAATYARRVGDRLRNVRRQQRLSLHGVEDGSSQEFRASVLGAYERGERAISVPRLQRLAKFYNVPVDQLLPRDSGAEADWRSPDQSGSDDADTSEPGYGKLTIDLIRLDGSDLPEKDLLVRYVGALQLQRQDFNGRVLSIRNDDVRLIACMIGMNSLEFRRRLEDLGLAH